jgi:hypothetical protein
VRARTRAALVVALTACGARPVAPRPRVAGPARLALHVDARDPRAVRATGRFVSGASATLALPPETLAGLTSFEVRRGGRWVALDPRRLEAPECVTDCTIRYTIDLANVERSFEGVVAVGEGSYVAPSPTWIAHPDPMPRGAFDLTIDGAAAAGATFTDVPFATGLRRRDATHFELPTDDYYEGSFAAFGKLRHRSVEASGGRIDVVLVSDTKLAMSDDDLVSWIVEDAGCVAQLYRRFPVKRATVFVVPIDGARDVVFGKVLSMGGASVIALTGTRFTSESRHNDWVLVHEMTHLGFPTLGGVRWLTEGLATYYEPVLRTRAGWHDAKWLWSWFASQMSRGVPARGEELALDKREGIDAVYWGGAIFVLLADVGIREATHGTKSLDDVLRGVLDRGGDATAAWTLPRVLAVARDVTGTRVLDDLVERLAVRGERVDLHALFAKLGVRDDAAAKAAGQESVALDDAAPEAAVRKAIESGR